MLIFIFLLGLSVGSFLNVLIDRLPIGQSAVRERSYCEHCRHKLAWFDLIPILSFILLNRRCRYCKGIISWQYPIVESLTAVFFGFTYSTFTASLSTFSAFATFIYLLIVVSGLMVIFFTDLKYLVIPDQVIFGLVGVSLFYLILLSPQALANHFISGLSLLTIFGLLVLVTRGRGMGIGDVKFAFFMGLFLGFPKVVVSFYISFLTGAIISLILVSIGKKKMKSTIPFGPFLASSTLISLFYGQSIWSFVLRFLNLTI